ncbi:hypothetical protein NMU03_17050 [Allocoprobacillus halotolerans]|uniref:Fur-regulated basic protein FbpA n=1 Tax=Allocoprobacillus halotolerans TaxID=2944914 RepID=A0ABY5I5K1_9FIRM|nr:hypothetical protein [Allocoprobacillus halotolerans]UTY39227.1 hypothetical protein NMU03_17050 [Allocoprobacillus halotolerans]
MEIRKMIFDGVEYNCLTNQELEMYVQEFLDKRYIQSQMNEYKKGNVKGYSLDEFKDKRKEIYK